MAITESLLQDVRLAVRSLRRSPASTIVTVALLAMGISAVTTVFSCVYSILYRQPPYPRAEYLVAIGEVPESERGPFSAVSKRTIGAVRSGANAFQQVAAFREFPVLLWSSQSANAIGLTEVDSELFDLLGVKPRMGRFFTAEELHTEAPVLVISDDLWRGRFGASDSVLGAKVRIGSELHTIVGVAPPGFRFNLRADAWRPIRFTGTPAGSDEFSLIARLRSDASLASARLQVAVIGRRLMEEDSEYYRNRRLVVRSSIVERGSAAPVTLVGGVFFAAAMCVLLIACVNVANILLARSAETRRAIAIRAALGATRARLIRESLVESAVLGVLACISGLALSTVLLRALWSVWSTHSLPSWVRLTVDARIVAFTCGASILAVIAIGGRAAVQGTHCDLASVLKSNGDSAATSRGSRRRGRRGVMLQFSASTLLLIAGALLAATYREIARIPPGDESDRVVRVFLAQATTSDPDERRTLAAYADLTVRLRAIPGTQAIASRAELAGPLEDAEEGSGGRIDTRVYDIETDVESLERFRWPRIRKYVVSEEYFRTVGIRLRAGRLLTATEPAAGELVAVVSEAFASILAPPGKAVGRYIRIGRSGPQVRIVGIVSNVRIPQAGPQGLTYDPIPHVYLSDTQWRGRSSELLVRTAGNVPVLERYLETELRKVSGDARILSIGTLRSDQSRDLLVVTLLGAFMTAFAVAGLVLATAGAYGVVRFGVANRTREFGVRIALGATPRMVRWMVIRECIRDASLGLTTGLVLAVASGHVLHFFVWGVDLLDPRVYIGVITAIVGITLLSSYLPTSPVLRIDAGRSLTAE